MTTRSMVSSRRSRRNGSVVSRVLGPQLLDEFSHMNIFAPPSTSSSEEVRLTGEHRGVTQGHSLRLIDEIVNSIFDERKGTFEASSSHCSSPRLKSSEHSYDRRLKYWRAMLEERRQIAAFVKKKTGKRQAEVLFNRTTTVDQRDRQTVVRVLDYAQRMNPIVLMNRQEARMQGKIDPMHCTMIRELRETLPKAEREGGTNVEIIGLPAASKVEQLGKLRDQGQERQAHWLHSKVLHRRVEEQRSDIERVVEHYPDIENLQVVGESLNKAHNLKHNSDIQLLGEEHIQQISSDTSLCDSPCKPDGPEVLEETVDFAVRINDQVFKLAGTRSSKIVETEIRFECEPFERVVKRVLRLENIGRKVINCEWIQRPFFPKTPLLLKSSDDEFAFDHAPFRLAPGDERDVIMLYQPRKINVVKEKWSLKINPQFFCRRTDSVLVMLSGRCKPSPEYVAKLNETQRIVIEKSNMQMMERLTKGLASLTPLIQPQERYCPYKRVLYEAELFESYNIGYKCDRLHDLELLKDIYARVKFPRERPWDFCIDTLKRLILRLPSPEQRALIFGEMVGVLEQMKGQPIELEQKMSSDNPESERTRYLYVRGTISAAIDDWEEITVTVEEAFFKPALEEYYATMKAADEADPVTGVDNAENIGDQLGNVMPELPDDNAVHEFVLKKVRRRKAFRDTLYMHTYTHLCNFVDNMVSVIESTEVM